MSSTAPENIQLKKLKASKKLKNIFLSIIFANLTFLSCLSIFFLTILVIIAGSAQKNRVSRVSGNTGIFMPYLFAICL